MTVGMQEIRIEEISVRQYGNPLIARGAFGEVSIGILIPPPLPSPSPSPSSPSPGCISAHLLRKGRAQFIAVKLIRNALHYKSDSDDANCMDAYANVPCLSPSWNLAAASSITEGGCSSQSPPETTTKNDDRRCEMSAPVFQEVAALRALGTSHPNITPLLSTFTPPGHTTSLSLSFPYCPTDLSAIMTQLRRKRQLLSIPHTKAILRDVLSGLSHCHRLGILHCDIKPSNLLLTQGGVVQLADFGLARLADPPSGTQTQTPHGLGTLHYRPPEILYGSREYTFAVDVWGCGLVLAEALNGRPLFPGQNVLDQLSRIFAVVGVPDANTWKDIASLPDYGKVDFYGNGRSSSLLRDAVPRIGECADLLEAMLTLDPKERPLAGKCLRDFWFFRKPAASGAGLIARELIPEELAVGGSGLGMGGGGGGWLEGMKRRGVALAAAQRKERSGLFGGVGGGEGEVTVPGCPQDLGASELFQKLASCKS